MVYLAFITLAILIAVITFVQIQLYLNHPLHRQWCDEWFARFEEANRLRFTDPELAWRTEAFGRMFYHSR